MTWDYRVYLRWKLDEEISESSESECDLRVLTDGKWIP